MYIGGMSHINERCVKSSGVTKKKKGQTDASNAPSFSVADDPAHLHQTFSTTLTRSFRLAYEIRHHHPLSKRLVSSSIATLFNSNGNKIHARYRSLTISDPGHLPFHFTVTFFTPLIASKGPLSTSSTRSAYHQMKSTSRLHHQ